MGAPVTVEGWLRTRRDSKAGLSFLQVHDGSCFEPIQVVARRRCRTTRRDPAPDHALRRRGDGTLVESQGKGQRFEVKAIASRWSAGSKPRQLPGLGQAAHDGAPADGGPPAAADQHVRSGRAGSRLPVDGRAPVLPRARFRLGAHADHHHQRRRGGRGDVPRLDARPRQSARATSTGASTSRPTSSASRPASPSPASSTSRPTAWRSAGSIPSGPRSAPRIRTRPATSPSSG